MIKVNLVGAGRKKKAKAGIKISLPTNFMPVVLLLVILGSGAGGYWWYTKTANTLADLDKEKADREK